MNAQIVEGLPSVYQRVEYIESTGLQGFEIDYIINDKDTEIYVDAQSTTDNIGSYIFGNDSSLSNIRIYLEISTLLVSSFASNKRSMALEGRLDRHTISLGKYIVVDNIVSPFAITDDNMALIEENESKIALFGLNGIHGLRDFANAKIYEFKISVNETDKVKLIPCYRKDDNVIGMYDVINDRFYQNEGSREFLKGEDVN